MSVVVNPERATGGADAATRHHIQFGNLFSEARNESGMLTDIVITPLTPELARELEKMFREYADRFVQGEMGV